VDPRPLAADDRPEQPTRTGPVPVRRPPVPRSSVWHYLVALALLPSVALTAGAALAVRDRMSAVSAADRTEQAADAVTGLDDLRLAVRTEAEASVADDALARLGTTAAELNRSAGTEIVAPAAVARRATDAALAAVRRNASALTDDGAESQVDAFAGRLATVRLRVDGYAFGAPSGTTALDAAGRAARAWGVTASFRSLDGDLAGLERAAVAAILESRDGAGDPAARHAAAELAIVSRLALLGGDRSAALSRLRTAPPSAVPGVLTELRDADAAYRVAAAEAAVSLTPPTGVRWREFATGTGATSLDALVTATAATPAAAFAGPPSPTMLDQVVAAATRTAAVADALAELTSGAADRVASAAAAERRAAVNDLVAVAAATAAVLVLTLTVLLVVGAVVRRRLVDLAAAARRLGSDRPLRVAVHGPREIGLVEEGINEAVANLSRVSSTVDQLADAVRDRERLEQELTHQATHDALTGLVNRHEGERLIEAALHRSRDERTRVGMLFVDLDHFKGVNETHGQHAGDHVLQVCAARVEAQVGHRGLVSRFGGDEFVVLLEEVTSEFAAIDLGERIVATLGEPIQYDGHELFVGASVGVAVAEAGSIDGEELLGRSDGAVYRAKAAGRGGVVAR
jgi:diguanylate cyclase (GGDEF)-like protein